MSAKGKGSLTMMMVRRAMASFLARMLAEISLESVGMSASTQFEKGKNFLHLCCCQGLESSNLERKLVHEGSNGFSWVEWGFRRVYSGSRGFRRVHSGLR